MANKDLARFNRLDKTLWKVSLELLDERFKKYFQTRKVELLDHTSLISRVNLPVNTYYLKISGDSKSTILIEQWRSSIDLIQTDELYPVPKDTYPFPLIYNRGRITHKTTRIIPLERQEITEVSRKILKAGYKLCRDKS